jgi:hypothetical protein
MHRAAVVALLLFLSAGHVVSLGKATGEAGALPHAGEDAYQLPGPLLKITSMEFDGIVSDFLFLKALIFVGKSIEQNRLTRLKDSEWEGFASQVRAVADLDPYFEDPYYMGNAFLPWFAGRVDDANMLLDKGSRYRYWDWTMPFYAGFNCFYFLQDNEKAASYLMEASKRPGATPLFASLASKLAFKAQRIEISILFLEEMIRKTDDPSVKEMFEKRIKAFQAIRTLESAVDAYRKKFGRMPGQVDDLMKKGLIAEIPKDPYQGAFFLDAQGKVRSTTEALLMPHQRAARR